MEKPSKTGLGGTAGRSGGKARRKPGGPTLREPEADDVVSTFPPVSLAMADYDRWYSGVKEVSPGLVAKSAVSWHHHARLVIERPAVPRPGCRD